jgi:hypothetical protein
VLCRHAQLSELYKHVQSEWLFFWQNNAVCRRTLLILEAPAAYECLLSDEMIDLLDGRTDETGGDKSILPKAVQDTECAT